MELPRPDHLAILQKIAAHPQRWFPGGSIHGSTRACLKRRGLRKQRWRGNLIQLSKDGRDLLRLVGAHAASSPAPAEDKS